MNNDFDPTRDYPENEPAPTPYEDDSLKSETVFENNDPIPDEIFSSKEDDVFIDGEYHYSVPNRSTPAYSDAGYVPSDQAGAVPPRYRCTVQSQKKEAAAKVKKPKRSISAAAVICMCLVCALIGGLAGGGAVLSLSGDSGEDTTLAEDPSGTVITKVDSSQTTTGVSTSLVSPGAELTGTEVYNLGTSQSVAITTEITYKNAWGFVSSGAVSGSGFVISSDGYILTNYHVIEDAATGGYEITVIFYDGREYTATIVGYEADNDVAVLKIDAEGLDAVTIGDSDSILVGEQVYAIGNPLGELSFSQTTGYISALGREITTTDSQTNVSQTIEMFQFDAAVNSGNSGGPVYNSRGEVIGIVTAKFSDSGVEGLGFAIPINDAISIADDLITNGYVSGKASLGISVRAISSTVAQYYNMTQGLYVLSVNEGSCAEEAGILVGDIITALNGVQVTTESELKSEIKNYSAGDTSTITIYRNGEYIDLPVIFDEYVPEEAVISTADSNSGNNNYGRDNQMLPY